MVNYAGFQLRRTITVGTGGLVEAHFSEDESNALVYSDQDGQARLYALSTGKPLGAFQVPNFEVLTTASFAFAPPPATESAILWAADDGIRLVDINLVHGGQLLVDRGAWELEWSRDGSVIGATSSHIPEQTSELAFYSGARLSSGGPNLTPETLLVCSERVDGWALSPDKTQLLVSHYPSNHIVLYDLRAGSVVWRLPAPDYGRSVDISPDGTLAAVSGNEVWLFPLADPGNQARYSKFQNNVHRVRFSPDGRALAVSAYDGAARLLSTQAAGGTLPLLKRLPHNGSANVYAVTFSRDGRRLLTSSGDQTLRVWGQ